MASYSLGHIHLMSENPSQAVQFYQTMFNARLVEERQGPSGRDYYLGIDGVRLIISGGLSHIGAGEPIYSLDHFGLTTPNLAQVASELKAKGMQFKVEPYTPRPGLHYACLKAPDAVRIELLQYD